MNIVVITIIILIIVFRLYRYTRRIDNKRNIENNSFNLSENIGNIGEFQIKQTLSTLPKEDYICLHDVMLYTDSHRTSQIDHIVISKRAVFVIETKNYKGKIYGSENGQHWKQYLTYYQYRRQYSNEYELYNPILQNLKHREIIKKYIQHLGNIRIIPVVCFLNECELHINVQEAVVMHEGDLLNFIIDNDINCYTKETQHEIANIIMANNITDTNERENHKKLAIQAREFYQNMEFQNKCPRCGSPLVLKHGKYGDFYGCSKFPTCKYTSQF